MKVISMGLQHVAIFLMLYDKRDWAIFFNNYKALKPFVIQFLFGVIKKIHSITNRKFMMLPQLAIKFCNMFLPLFGNIFGKLGEHIVHHEEVIFMLGLTHIFYSWSE